MITLASDDLKDPSRPAPFSMPAKLFMQYGKAKSYCLTVRVVPESILNYLYLQI